MFPAVGQDVLGSAGFKGMIGTLPVRTMIGLITDAGRTMISKPSKVNRNFSTKKPLRSFEFSELIDYLQSTVFFTVLIFVSFNLIFIMDNKISIEIPPADLLAVKDAIAVLQAKLGPFLIALTADQRKGRTKMGEASKPFVEKVLEYIRSNVEFLPAFANADEMDRDWKAHQELNPVYNQLNQLVSNLSDTLLQLGYDLMKPSNAYYNQAKSGVKMDVPNAKPVYEDLKVRYERKPRKKTNGTES